MAVDTRAFQTCSYGDAGVVLSTYKLSETPIIQQDKGRTGTTVQVVCVGTFDADTAEDYATKAATITSAMRSSGLPFAIVGLGQQQMYSINPAVCREGGPHVTFDITTGNSPLQGVASFTVDAKVDWSSNNSNQPSDTYSIEYKETPNGLLTVTRSGTINGSNSGAYFAGNVLPAFVALYAPPTWVVTLQYTSEGDANSSKTTYQLQARQLANPLPTYNVSPTAVDGSYSIDTSRDEQMRLTTTHSFSLTFNAMPSLVTVSQLRPETGVIVRESCKIEQIADFTLQATFELLDSASGNNLLNYQQTVSIDGGDDVWEARSFPGLKPVLVKKPQAFATLQQSGTATGINVMFNPIPPLFADQYVDVPRVAFVQSNASAECVTTWSYTMYLDLDLAVSDLLVQMAQATSRPTEPASITSFGSMQ